MNEFLKRYGDKRIRQIKAITPEKPSMPPLKFKDPFYGITFTSSNYKALDNGYYQIYDNPDFLGFTCGVPIQSK